MHNCWQQLSTRWFTKTKAYFSFLRDGLEVSIREAKFETLACYFLPLGPNSARLAVCSNLTPNVWCSSDHISLEGFKSCGQSQHRGTDKHKFKAKAHSNIFKTLHCPSQWKICIRKHVCLQQDQSKARLTQGENNVTVDLNKTEFQSKF